MNQLTRTSLLFFTAIALASQTRGTEPVVVGRSVAAVTNVSDSFREKVQLASLTIPDHVWQAVERSGWKVRMAEFVVDAAPTLVNRRPRGWPDNATWNNSDAVHLPKSKLLVLAEKRRTTGGLVVNSNRVPGVLRHEFGHAFDVAVAGPYGARSADPNFAACYGQDIETLTDLQREQMEYYLQDQHAGRQEAFAEAFAILLGGGSDKTKEANFSASFPRVIQFVERAIKSAGDLRAAM